ncbi:MAG: DUF5710 domain-containing protein [Novosphingobium sp.]|nr:DUF5710 domain-containing protein [Novosphingobium sp.]
MNIFDMSVAHGGFGFWARRTTWDNSCARIVAIGLFTQPPPYFGNPPVLADIYSLTGQMKERAATLPMPGAYRNWLQIEEPSWATPDVLSPLDDPVLRARLSRLERGRFCQASERIRLTVPYARKDEAKALGARWDAVNREWWIPQDNPDAKRKAVRLGFLRTKPGEAQIR